MFDAQLWQVIKFLFRAMQTRLLRRVVTRPLYAITREDHPTSRGQPLSPNTRTVVTREEDETVRSLPLTNTHIDTQHTEYWHGARTPALE